jgi:hypothetical protein
MNAKLGIIGGIAFRNKWSSEAFFKDACRRSLVPQIDIALSRKYDQIFFVLEA